MWNGFYDLSHLNNTQLKRFFKECIFLSYKIHIDKLGDRWSREEDRNMSLKEYIDKFIYKQHHNVCIDRWEYNQGKIKDSDYIEVGNSFISGNNFLFIYINREKFQPMIEKYKLKKKEV